MRMVILRLNLTLLLVLTVLIVKAQVPDLRGPIVTGQFKVNVTREGVSASDFNYKVSNSAALSSNWIWLSPDKYPGLQKTESLYIGQKQTGEPCVVNFKKIITISDDVSAALIKMSADINYRIFINGHLLNRGPANIGSDYADSIPPQHWFYDEFKTILLKKGTNVIAIEVSTYDKTGSATSTGHGGLIMEAAITLKSGKTIKVATDSSWFCMPSKAYIVNPAQPIKADASSERNDWYYSRSYGSGWSRAVVLDPKITSAWKLRRSELPQMMEARIYPASITMLNASQSPDPRAFPLNLKPSGTPQKLRITFNKLYTGHLGLYVEGKRGTAIEFATQEIEGVPVKKLTYILQDGVQTYEFWGIVDARYVDITVTNPNGDLKINEIVMNHSSFPVSYTGNFNCSDTLLNALWKNIRWITQMNMQSHHMDSPEHQEPLCDAGDYLVESMVNYYTFNSPLLIKQDLRKIVLVMAKTHDRMFHTSYMLLWQQMLLNYYRYTGDKTLLKELSPSVYRLTDRFETYVGPSGIITQAPNYMFIDWGNIGNVGFHHPPASLGQGYLTALYYKSLVDGAVIAATVGDNKKAADYTKKAKALKYNFVNTLFNKQTQLFDNGLPYSSTIKPYTWLPKDTVFSFSLPYVNAVAALYGLAPAGTEKDMVRYVLQQNHVVLSPYFMYFVFDAMVKTNLFGEYGLDQLHRWAAISNNPVGLRELWGNGDYSHAWGGSPAYILSSTVLGVTPAKPGFVAVHVAPNTLNLGFANGIVPTPHGNIAVSWKNNAKLFSITYKAAVSTPVTFSLPVYKRNDVFVNGKEVIGDNKIINTPGIVSVSIKSGKLELETNGVKQQIRIINKD